MSAHRKRRKIKSKSKPGPEGARNAYLDGLRGLAIVLMVIDHTAGILVEVPINFGTIRFATRLSMPLFAILMGYFLTPGKLAVTRPRTIEDNRSSKGHFLIEWFATSRLMQILVAGVLTNLLYYYHYGVLDILAGLAVCYPLFLLLNDKFVYLLPIILLYPYDPLNPLFDYPLTIVISLVAQGMLLRQRGLGLASLSAVGLTLVGMAIISQPSFFVLLFTLPATVLIGLAARSKGFSHPWLVFLGRHPLTVYVVQYYVLFAIASFMRRGG